MNTQDRVLQVHRTNNTPPYGAQYQYSKVHCTSIFYQPYHTSILYNTFQYRTLKDNVLYQHFYRYQNYVEKAQE
jgi:hypothetical protein